ncbi:hypothetical protein, partial [uncultured Caballeronia sp.]|uniref:hypothetical protein n=1 Tax=uncultured Caballeronia sp. TaxID=1827198 RepID=UPI0035CC5283
AVFERDMDVQQQRDFSMRRLHLAVGSIGINVQACLSRRGPNDETRMREAKGKGRAPGIEPPGA